MNKQHIITISLLAMATTAMAQETYESAQIATEDLSGTARYQAMGGAMEALGADISTIGTNPAGIGFFRRSWAGMSASVSILPKQDNLDNTGKTVVGFDQAGFVYSTRMNENSFINFAVNYQKSRDFNQILPAISALNNSSLNLHSYIAAASDWQITQTDYLLDNTFLLESPKGDRSFSDATDYQFRKETNGYINRFDINLSYNQENRIYWGITFGIHDVHYKGNTEYIEYLIDKNREDIGNLYLNDSKSITGTGFDIKAGVIIRPIEYSPFRIGFSIATPTWYTLDTNNFTYLYNNTDSGERDQHGNKLCFGMSNYAENGETNKYKMHTPWKFGVSMGHTINNELALGLSYEYADYSSIDNRIITDEYDYGSYTDYSARSDDAMNKHTDRTLKGVHTLKAGAEYKISPEFAVRLGYNYVSPMYKTNGAKDFSLNSGFEYDGLYYSSTTDYVNWGETHRATAGFGYSHKNFSIDLAYVYNTQKGEFHPFPNTSFPYLDENNNPQVLTNSASPVKIKNDRHKVLMTLGYKF